MPLARQNISIPIGQGINSKTDSKQLAIGNLVDLQNAVFTKQSLLSKRFGLDLLDKSINITDDPISSGAALSTFKDQLLLFTGEKAYSRLSFNEKWSDKGDVYSIINESNQIIRNDFSQSNPSSAKVNNLECFVFEDSRGGIRYSILDSETKNFVVTDKLLSLTGSSPIVYGLQATAGTAAQFVIVFITDNFIKYARINTEATYLNVSIQTLTSDLHENQVFDVSLGFCTVNDELSNAVFVTYAGRYDDGYVYTNPRTYRIDYNTATLYSYDATLSQTPPTLISTKCVEDPSFEEAADSGSNPVILWTDGYDLKLGKIPYYIGTLTSFDITVPVQFDVSSITKMSLSPTRSVYTNQIDFDLILEVEINDSKILKHSILSAQIHGEITAVSAITSFSSVKFLGLYSKLFFYNGKNYFVASYESDLQSTYYLMNCDLQPISKAHQNEGAGHRTNLCDVVLDGYSLEENLYFEGSDGYNIKSVASDGKIKVPLLKKSSLQSINSNVFSNNGVSSFQFDFDSSKNFSSSTVGDNLIVAGGIVSSYDGNVFTENNFLLYPENISVSDDFVFVSTTTQGTGVAQEVTSVQFTDGYRISSGDYWLLNSANNDREYYVWYRVNGIGSDPALNGKTGIQVNIKSYHTGTQIASASASAINLVYTDFTASSSSNILTVTNTIPGVTTNSSVGTMTVGSMSAGTYQYVLIWKWIDNQGRIHRSTTSIPISVTLSDTDQTVSIMTDTLSLTNKSGVVLEVYRTEDLGSIFYKTTTATNVINIDDNHIKVVAIDSTSDADLISNEILYTTGEVLDNSCPESCSILAVYKNRLMMAGLEDKNSIKYSKISQSSQKDFATGFSDLFKITMSPEGGDITGLAQLDDKLIIFKEKQIYYLAGDGPNNLGSGSTFTDPQLITTDVGCVNSNSIAITPNGLMFKSSKGIYSLSRGLQVAYAGAAVEKFNSQTITSAVLLNDVNQVRFITDSSTALVYDYFFDQWSTFTSYSGVDADVFNNEFVILKSNGYVLKENKESFVDYNEEGSVHIPLVIETGNLSFAGLNGFQRIYRTVLLGEYKGNHNTLVSFSYDFSPTFSDSSTFDGYSVIQATSFGEESPYGDSGEYPYGGEFIPYQFRTHMKRQKCTALRIKIQDIQTDNFNEGFNLSGITLEVGVKAGTYKLGSNKSLGSE
jgi:hypothetical protein